MKFTLEIELGHDGMLTYDQLADALYDVRQEIQGDANNVKACSPSPIRDANGNRVGKWEVIAAPRIPPALTAHEYQPNDLGTDGCSVCGKARAWRFHSYIRGKAAAEVENFSVDFYRPGPR